MDWLEKKEFQAVNAQRLKGSSEYLADRVWKVSSCRILFVLFELQSIPPAPALPISMPDRCLLFSSTIRLPIYSQEEKLAIKMRGKPLAIKSKPSPLRFIPENTSLSGNVAFGYQSGRGRGQKSRADLESFHLYRISFNISVSSRSALRTRPSPKSVENPAKAI